MFRGYRRIYSALAGLALVGAANPPKEGEEKQQQAPQSEFQKAASSIAAAITTLDKPAEKDAGCQDRRDKRDSDLCAQWKAADAAHDAARFAFWTLLLSAGGTGLLIWTLWETRATSRRELRAYVSARPRSLEKFDAGQRPQVDLLIRNEGITPAYDVVHYGNIAVFDLPLSFDPGNLHSAPVEQPAPFALFSNDARGGRLTAINALSTEEIDGIRAGAKGLFAYGEVVYRDTFNTKRCTEFCAFVSGEGFSEARILSRANPGKEIPIEWMVAPFRNNAT